jgi:hypothetical protein
VPAPLPPLPPVFGVRGTDLHPGGRGILDILREDHRRIARLCTLPPTAAAADVVIAALTRHLSAEAQYLYPAVRAALPDGATLADHHLAEHTALLRTLTRPAPPAALLPLLETHARSVENSLFPALRAAYTDADLIRLGNRAAIAQEAAPTRPHPDAPQATPMVKLTDPTLGVLDKLRDALTGRRTHPDQLNI